VLDVTGNDPIIGSGPLHPHTGQTRGSLLIVLVLILAVPFSAVIWDSSCCTIASKLCISAFNDAVDDVLCANVIPGTTKEASASAATILVFIFMYTFPKFYSGPRSFYYL